MDLSRSRALYPVLLTVIVMLVYVNSISNGFVWDDSGIIVGNQVNRDLGRALELFTSPDTVHADERTPYYRPLNRLTYLLDFQMFGLNPAGYHVENVFLHLVTVLLVYRLLCLLFKDRSIAFLSGLVFAVHPMNAEAVNFISGRNNLLAAVCVLLAFLSYARGRDTERTWLGGLAGLFFLLALLAKESAVMLPVVLMLYDWEAAESVVAQMRRKIVSLAPFIAAGVSYAVLRHFALSGTGWGIPAGNLSLSGLVRNVYVIPRYVLMFVAPVKLHIYYRVPESFLEAPLVLLAGWGILLLLLWYLLRVKSPVVAFGMLWTAINYIPISNIVPIPSAPMAERYMYLPAIGLCAVTGELLCRTWRNRRLRSVSYVALVVLMAASILTVKRNFAWRDDIALFTSQVSMYPDDASAFYNLGNAYMAQGDTEKAKDAWARAIAIAPAHTGALNALGSLYYLSGDLSLARKYFERALLASPENAQAHYNLALTLEAQGELAAARKHYEMFLKRVPPEYVGQIPEIERRLELLSRKIRENPVHDGS